MSRYTLRVITVIVTLLCMAVTGYASSKDLPIRNNPFKRPILEDRSATNMNSNPSSDKEWQPELRATLVSGAASLANVGGEIVGIGEVVDGYRLLSVDEGVAVFVKNGDLVTLTVDQEILKGPE